MVVEGTGLGIDTFDVATSPIYVVTIEGTDPFIKINQFWRIAYLKLMFQ